MISMCLALDSNFPYDDRQIPRPVSLDATHFPSPRKWVVRVLGSTLNLYLRSEP